MPPRETTTAATARAKTLKHNLYTSSESLYSYTNRSTEFGKIQPAPAWTTEGARTHIAFARASLRVSEPIARGSRRLRAASRRPHTMALQPGVYLRGAAAIERDGARETHERSPVASVALSASRAVEGSRIGEDARRRLWVRSRARRARGGGGGGGTGRRVRAHGHRADVEATIDASARASGAI